jgi:hypothetical protein
MKAIRGKWRYSTPFVTSALHRVIDQHNSPAVSHPGKGPKYDFIKKAVRASGHPLCCLVSLSTPVPRSFAGEKQHMLLPKFETQLFDLSNRKRNFFREDAVHIGL